MHGRITIIAIVLTVISLIILGVSMFPFMSKKIETSPHIAYLTQPIQSFTGTVNSIQGNSITVTKEAQIMQSNAAGITSSPQRTITYKVIITDKTRLNRQIMPFDYEQKTGQIQTNKSTINDIQKGDSVTVLTLTDLRFLTKDTFEATTVELPPLHKMVAGNIKRIDGEKIILQSIAAENPKDMTVSISKQTKVVKNTFVSEPVPQTKPSVVDVGALEPGQTVQIYLDKSIDIEPMNALYIEYTPYVTMPASAEMTPNPPVATPTLLPTIPLP